MKNQECIICGDEVINNLQKKQGKRKYCSEKCEEIPSVFLRWSEYQVWLINIFVATDFFNWNFNKNYPLYQNCAFNYA